MEEERLERGREGSWDFASSGISEVGVACELLDLQRHMDLA